jgi:hypothetical protein
MADSIFEVIDAADEQGYYSFALEGVYVDSIPTKGRQAHLKSLLEFEFHGLPIFTLKLDRVKKWVFGIETTSEKDADGNYQGCVNVAKMLFLPCEKPQQELAEMREFFAAMKPFFEAYPEHRVAVQLCNNRTHNGKVYGSLACQTPDSLKEGGLEHTKRINDLIAASPVLQSFMQGAALALQKIGPWSWTTLTEDHLYGSYPGGPWMQARAAKRDAERNSRTPEETAPLEREAKERAQLEEAGRVTLNI